MHAIIMTNNFIIYAGTDGKNNVTTDTITIIISAINN
jgi:hypothetical protein